MAPLMPSVAWTGSALASMSWFAPFIDRIVNREWAGRPWRSATVKGSSSKGTCSPFSSNGPNAVPHCSGPMEPASSKLMPSRAPAASL